MAHIIKAGSIKAPTQPKDLGLQATGLVFKSYDNQIALQFNVKKQDGSAADLLGATITLAMNIFEEVDGVTEKTPVPFIPSSLVVESYLNGCVTYILPEALKSYNGIVEAYLYIDYPDGSSSDNLGFTFRVKRSAIDKMVENNADYIIEDFEQLRTVINSLSQTTNEKIEEVENALSGFGKLKEMYSNSVDFGDYDYSQRPNLMKNVKYEDLSLDFTSYTAPTNVTMENDCFVIDVTTLTGNRGYYIFDIPRGLEGKRYTYSIEAKADVPTGGVAIRSVYYNGSSLVVLTPSNVGSLTDTMTRYKMTTNALTNQQVNSIAQAIQIYVTKTTCTAEKIYIKTNVKLEEGTEVSDFQPNLLAEPYNVCREYPNENIAGPAIEFPINSSKYLLYNVAMTEPFVVGETYTVTLKATKPASQTFMVYNTEGENTYYGNLEPVEGITNLWSLTFTPEYVSPDTPNDLRIFQSPSSTAGACRIDWLKIEKGDTYTPINTPTFKGLALAESDNPNDYSWTVEPHKFQEMLT